MDDAFVLGELPPSPARVLEIGCGAGELALEISEAGYDVLAIDPEAPEGPIFRQTTLEQLDESGAFHAVVASRSLHHIHDLDAAVGRIQSLVRPAGRLILVDFAWERMDPDTADCTSARSSPSRLPGGSTTCLALSTMRSQPGRMSTVASTRERRCGRA